MSLYEIAWQLKQPVYKIMEEMPYEEVLGWHDYFKRKPIGFAEDQRTYMLLAAQGVKQKAENLFPSLAQLQQNQQELKEEGRIEANNLRRSFVFTKLLGAKGGDKLDALER
jgi:hypothetical protein